ncbi:class I SAM-dependent methyltransferase [Oscillatoria acuminata]|uniref:Methylase involved in ubiquinone/menaquinone biosynthesis n=1 Tax=Oscillatoria acuminata PCC 6304 TaxID=56110 RepID=K9TIW1_9CYAN|nr:methyltransferase domain-containing protein [Oscillatoria acuminata]AFY82762.1 methylase involved in ubiquinone/menaquinone biosynthesis [Oscillatoria acuminata PCC 6304]
MNNPGNHNDYKQQIADYFNRRTNYDQEGDFHPIVAHHLIQYADIQPGQHILDIATGTGLVAIEAAQIVGNSGSVVGVDLSEGMLRRSHSKIAAARLTNIELKQGDIETIEFPTNRFDRIFCCCGIPYIPNIPTNLRRWHNFLKPGGIIALTGIAETASIVSNILIKIAKNYGLELPIWSEVTGTPEKCRNLLQTAGFEQIQVTEEQFGDYFSLESAENLWEMILNNPLSQMNFVQHLNSDQLNAAKALYLAELETLVTQQGIWNDLTIYYMIGRKPIVP